MKIYYIALFFFLITFIIKNFSYSSELHTEICISAKGLSYLAFFLCVAIGGLRWETGTDWPSYLDFFEKNNTWDSFNSNPSFEIGWKILNFSLKRISCNYTFFLCCFHFLILLFTILSVNNFEKVVNFDVSFFYLLNFAARKGDFFATRQFLAMQIMLYSVSLLFLNKKKSYIFWGLIAVSIHITTIVIFILPFIQKLKLKKIHFILIISILFVFIIFGKKIFFSLIEKIIPMLPGGHLYGKVITYTNLYKNETERIGLFTLLRLIIFIPPIIFSYKKSSNFHKAVYNDYLLGICLYIICSNVMPILIRIPQNIINLEALALSIYFKSLKKTSYKYFMLIFIISYAVFKYIYSFYGEYSDLYIPYYSIFNKGIRQHF